LQKKNVASSASLAPNDEVRVTNDECRISTFVILAFILIAYLVIGVLYAVKTPAWQVPDEPAHYNYVRFVAEGRGLPVLQPGDYDGVFLENVKAARFPSSIPIDSIRYEFWQPPLYYLLAAPVYVITGGSLLALRLFSVVLGGFVLLLACLIVRRLAPNSPALALGTAAFVAFVPQHVAMMAGAQNDSLAELLLAASVLRVSDFRCQRSKGFVATGALMGLALMTKGTIYIVVPLAAVAILLVYRALPAPCNWTWMIKRGALVFVPALAIALPWWVRNVGVYGWPDVLVSIRHDAVVIGQATPAEWVAKFGWGGYLREFAVTTFHSFWGQFGWMGVPMNDKTYAVLALASLAAFIGLLWYSNVKGRSEGADSRLGLRNLEFEIWILISWVFFALLVYLGYNIKYVQFQGRYLFSALVPIGLAFTVGLRQWTTLLPRGWRDGVLAVPYIGLAALDIIALFRMILPALTR
jgi:4-amino-4-deoxy-L-arabinose transferase-like glycosyltransferase